LLHRVKILFCFWIFCLASGSRFFPLLRQFKLLLFPFFSLNLAFLLSIFYFFYKFTFVFASVPNFNFSTIKTKFTRNFFYAFSVVLRLLMQCRQVPVLFFLCYDHLSDLLGHGLRQHLKLFLNFIERATINSEDMLFELLPRNINLNSFFACLLANRLRSFCRRNLVRGVAQWLYRDLQTILSFAWLSLFTSFRG